MIPYMVRYVKFYYLYNNCSMTISFCPQRSFLFLLYNSKYIVQTLSLQTLPLLPTTQTPAEASIAKLQEAVVELTIHPATVYNGTDYSKEFNAAFYYIANPDLQTAIGVNAKKLLEHYVKYGKAEGRLAIAR